MELNGITEELVKAALKLKPEEVKHREELPGQKDPVTFERSTQLKDLDPLQISPIAFEQECSKKVLFFASAKEEPPIDHQINFKDNWYTIEHTLTVFTWTPKSWIAKAVYCAPGS